MRIAIPVFGQRIAPRLDRAHEVLIFNCANGQEPDLAARLNWAEETILKRVKTLESQRVDWLICGALEPWAEEVIRGQGIQVAAWISGTLEAILKELAGGGPQALESHSHQFNWSD
ncbi:MAG: hypothetical protein JRJ59_12345 [Deltaproteobacteria bacterium]|nr:hypothetical protein [Deltaproteobacteria bacterium]